MSGPIESAFKGGRELTIERERLGVWNLSESPPTTIGPTAEMEEETNHGSRQANAEITEHSQNEMSEITQASTATLDLPIDEKNVQQESAVLWLQEIKGPVHSNSAVLQ